MTLSNHPSQRFIEASLLEGWKSIGYGGFGHIFRARHSEWCADVAVKLLKSDNDKALLREIEIMLQGSSPYVIHVHGIFKGQLPLRQHSQLGLVMEFMERGSLSHLQNTLDEPPPWPLVIRLAHQVALGINFLHSLKPPVLHLDLKPSNVLLDPALNAKLTDFGLSRCYHSQTRLSRQDSEEEGGTLPYMPPEAWIDVSYKPTQATDIYSYSILLWSIVTGKKPYENALSSIVRLRVPDGQRPSVTEFELRGSGLAGSELLKDLMLRCWAGDCNQRPSSRECTTETEELYKMHKHAIVDVVHQVLKKLDQKEQEDGQPHQVLRVPERCEKVNADNSVPTGPPPVEEVFISLSANHTQAPGFKDFPSYQPADTCEVDTGHSQMDHKERKSSVHPILSSNSSPSKVDTTPSNPGNRVRNFLCQILMPRVLPCYPPSPPEHFINMNDVTEIQNNNTMHINNAASQQRRHHLSAPSSDKEDETEEEGDTFSHFGLEELFSGSVESLEDFCPGVCADNFGDMGL